MIETLIQTAPIPLGDLWGNTTGFVAIFVICMGIIGLGSGSMTVASLTAYVAFVYIVTTAGGMPMLENFVLVTLVLICMGLGFKFIRTEVFGGGS